MATRILLVDDSQTIRVALRRPLEGAGHIITEAVDGMDALAKFHASPENFDIVISDINMPNMDGLTLCEKIKELDKTHRVPLLIISTETSPEMKARGKQIGVTAWMNKPPNPVKLLEALAKIEQMIAAKKPPA